MMEECKNKEHYDKNQNDTDDNINNMNEVEGTFSYIPYPAMMKEGEYTKHNNKMTTKQKLVWIPWIWKHKNDQISHPQL